mgnify:FL=1
MENKKNIILVLMIALIVGNVFFASNYFSLMKEMQGVQSVQVKIDLNEKVINFASMFIKKVLQANTEVDFETRLSLENAVRDLKDSEIMAEWQNFTNSQTEAEAQNSVKKLLGILITKIQK